MIMKWVRSDWNGSVAERSYLDEPTEVQIKEAIDNGGVIRYDKLSIRTIELDDMTYKVEVRLLVMNGIVGDIYRDIYFVSFEEL